MTLNTGIGAGFKYAFYALIDDTYGSVIGTSSTAPSAGNQDGDGMARLRGAQTIPLTSPEDEIVDVGGDDDDTLASFAFASGQAGRGTLVLAGTDLDFEAAAQGTSVQTVSGYDVGVRAPRGKENVDMCLLNMRRSRNATAGTFGNAQWEIQFIPKATITPLGTTFESRTGQPFNYSITASQAGAFPWGATLTTGNNGTTAATIVPILNKYPIHVKRFTGDSSETVFNLDYTHPTTDGNAIVTINEIVQSSGYTMAANTITFSSTPANNARIVVLYDVTEASLG